MKVAEFDVVFLSYDEPNADVHYADLCNKVPWAKRIHGVKGSDAAHKAAAELSETDWFVSVDADNIVNPKFFNIDLDFSNPKIQVYGWCGRNSINGLRYGNGGLKVWKRDFVLNMKTHEASDSDRGQVDFCWDVEYIQMNSCYSTIMNNASPQQAWRAGFREGVKMALDRGMRVSVLDFHRNHWKNLHRLYVWLMVGADVENGMWAIYGAREGLWRTMCTDWDFVNVRDFDYLNAFYNTEIAPITEEELPERVEDIGALLINELDIPIAETPFDASQSKFFKTVYQNPSRIPKRR